MTADNTGAKPYPEPPHDLSPLERLERLDHMESQERLRQAQSAKEGPGNGPVQASSPKPTGFQTAAKGAAILFAIGFFTHAAMAGVDIAKAIELGASRASSLQEDIMQMTILRIGIAEVRDASFLLLGWLAAVWLGRNSLLARRPS